MMTIFSNLFIQQIVQFPSYCQVKPQMLVLASCFNHIQIGHHSMSRAVNHELSQFCLRLDTLEQALGRRSLGQVGTHESILFSLHSRVIAAHFLNNGSSQVQGDLEGLVRGHCSKEYLIVPFFQLVYHFPQKPQPDALGCVLGQYGSINAVNGYSGLVVRLKEFILYLLNVLPLIADQFGLSLQPGGVLQLGVVIHVVVDADSDHLVLEVEHVGEAVLDAVLQLVVEYGIDLLIS